MSILTYHNDEKQVLSLDQILAKFSIFGRYHGLCMLLIIYAYMLKTVQTINYVFVTEEVSYRCKANTKVNGLNISEPCTDWIYNKPNSFVAEFELAGQDWKRAFVGSAHSFGNMIGLLIIGPISDRFGRKPTTIVSGLAAGVVGLAKTFSPWYWFYVALEVIEAIVGDFYSPIFMIGIEIVSTKQRMPFTMLTGLGYFFGGILMTLVAWLLPYWRTYLRVIYAPSLILLCYVFLLDESPRWLLSVGRKKEATKIVTKMSSWNNVNIENCQLQDIDYDKKEDVNFANLLKSTISSKTLLKRFCVCIVWWITCNFVYYGLILNSVSLQGDKYWNFALMHAVDLPVVILELFILHYFSRKVSLMSTFCIGAILCLIQPFTPTSMPWLSITLFLAGKIMSSFFFDVTYLYTSELFPTCTRNSMHSLCSAVGRIGLILAPQTPLLIKYWAGFPSITFGCVALFAAMLTLLVPDTAAITIPDTVKQAEGLDENFSVGAEITGNAKPDERTRLINYKKRSSKT